MKQSLFQFSILFLLFFFLGACAKEKGTDEPTDNPPETSYPTGTASFDANGYPFVATEARARYRSNGDGLGIEFKNEEGRILRIGLPEFSGVANYSKGNGTLDADYRYFFNSDFVSWSSIDPSELEVETFDENAGTLSGNFEMALNRYLNTLSTEQGVFENVPIVSLHEPPSGYADFYLKDIYYRTDSAYAEIRNNFQLVIVVPYSESESKLALKQYIGSEDYTLIPWLGFSQAYELFGLFSDNASEQAIDIDYENEKVSLSAFTPYSIDFDININEIPIVSFPMEVDSGVTKLIIDSDEYVFYTSTYQRTIIGESTIYQFEATNDTGNKIQLSFTSTMSDINQSTDEAGVMVWLKFYLNENNSTPTKNILGLFGDYHESGAETASVGFESHTAKMRAIGIPFIE